MVARTMLSSIKTVRLQSSPDEQTHLLKSLSDFGIRSSSVFKNVTLFRHHVLFLVDLRCLRKSLAAAPDHLRSPYRWLVLKDADMQQYEHLWNLSLPNDIDFVLAEERKDGFILTEIFKIFSNGTTQVRPRGYYNGSFVDTRVDRELFRRRRNLMRHPLTMSNAILDSNTTMYHLLQEDRSLLQYDADTKLNWVVFHLIAQMLNASTQHVFSQGYGYKSNGKWTGTIRNIQDGKADMGTGCFITKERLDIVVFTDFIAHMEVKFLFRQPPLSYVSNIFTLPFTLDVWLAILLFVIVSSVVVYLAGKWEASCYKDQTQHSSIASAVFFTISSLSQQSSLTEVRNMSSRLTIWWIFVAMMSLFTAYSANIVVLLQSPSTSIKTLEQLKNSKMTISALDANYNHFVLKAQKDPVRQGIYKRITSETGKPKFCNFTECIEKLRKGFFAYHAIAEPVYRYIDKHFLESEKCGLTGIDFMVAGDPYIPVDKFSPYLEIIRVCLKRIRETGLATVLRKRYLQEKPLCNNQSAFTSVGLIDMRPVLIFMLFGFLASIIVWIGEVIVFKMSASSRHTKKQLRFKQF